MIFTGGWALQHKEFVEEIKKEVLSLSPDWSCILSDVPYLDSVIGASSLTYVSDCAVVLGCAVDCVVFWFYYLLNVDTDQIRVAVCVPLWNYAPCCHAAPHAFPRMRHVTLINSTPITYSKRPMQSCQLCNQVNSKTH